jgi:RNA polymerase sigma factor (sigma-70 family)
MIAQHERALKQTARRYSLCADDAEDAYQRAMEILLTKAPTEQPRELSRWTHTVIRHEALAIRRNRERLLGNPATAESREGGGAVDWVELIPTAADDGPDRRVERRETIARSREALQALKPAELRALTLLAEGYSYAEIGQRTGWSYTKINRCLSEGRERFRSLVSRSEDGSRCAEMSPILSAFCDGETSEAEAAAVQEHLRACVHCRAVMRAYRATPGAAAVLAPTLPAPRSLLDRAHEILGGLHLRLPGTGGGADSTMAQVAAAGGTRGVGMAALAKVLAVCAGTAGGAAACVAAGVVPAPIGLMPDDVKQPTVERVSPAAIEASQHEAPTYDPTTPAADSESQPAPAQRGDEARHEAERPPPETSSVAADAGAVEYTPPAPAPTSPPVAEPAESSSGSAAGEFGP